MTNTSPAANGRATTTKTTFSRETTVSIDITAEPATVWRLLTNAPDFARWNSTMVSLEGEITLGQKLRLKSTLDEKRVFTLVVKEFEPEKQMVWGDGKGSRTYTLEPVGEGRLCFSMRERIGGLMFPMYAKYIPPFDEAFEQFAADLKREAEEIHGNSRGSA